MVMVLRYCYCISFLRSCVFALSSHKKTRQINLHKRNRTLEGEHTLEGLETGKKAEGKALFLQITINREDW